MTFGICLFVILMQFLWKYIDDMVGKGLEISLLMEMFFYAGLSLVHMALPLAILLASLMAFGNLGESFELTAIKSSGISLLKAMRPVIIVIAFVSVGAYFFQNNVMPVSQVKLWTILRSMQQKSPELNIPEGSFYKEIPNLNLYVKTKNRETGMLYDVMIYDFSKGFESVAMFVADSAHLKMSSDKNNLVFTLYDGESFQNLWENEQRGKRNKNIAYRRETFSKKEVFKEYNANFSMMDESFMQNQHIGKNRTELRSYIDSVSVVVDSVNSVYKTFFKEEGYMQSLKPRRSGSSYNTTEIPDTFNVNDFDAFFEDQPLNTKISVVSGARSKAEYVRNEYQFKAITQEDYLSDIRRHQMELNRKYTLSVACLIFLFIGAPLGAIIRKGGLGMPVVISVFLFIFYYIIDTFGVKMAKQGIWSVWQGMWLSSVVLFPLGAFLTHKAINDSVIFNPDTYINAFKRLFGKREKRNYAVKEIIMQYPDYPACLERLNHLDNMCLQYIDNNKKRLNYFDFWKTDFNQSELKSLVACLENILDELCNSDEIPIIGKLIDYPVVSVVHSEFLNNRIIKNVCAIFFPLGLCFYCVGTHKRKKRVKDMYAIREINTELREEIEMNLL